MKIVNFGQIFLSVFLIRLLITGASIGDALALIALGAVYSLHVYLDSKKTPDPSAAQKEEVELLKSRLQGLETKVGLVTMARR